jgi:uncharacterized membrane protein
MESTALKLHKIGISGVILCVIFLIAQAFLPIEFADENIKQVFTFRIWFGLPIFMIFTTFKIPYQLKSKFGKKDKLITIIVLAVLIFIVLFFYWFLSNMCGYITDEILFKKIDSSQKIVRRHYDCGAFDSDRPEYETRKIIPLVMSLQIYQKVDTNSLNRSEWIKP